jgi:hypothetical protein
VTQVTRVSATCSSPWTALHGSRRTPGDGVPDALTSVTTPAHSSALATLGRLSADRAAGAGLTALVERLVTT